MSRSALTVTVVAILAISCSVTASADDGGVDAPNAWSAANTYGPGSYTGEVGGSGDMQDWYRFLVPAGKIIRVTIGFAAGNPHVHLLARNDQGGYLMDSHVTWPQAVSFAGPVVRVGLDSWTSRAESYSINVEALDAPDFAPEAIEVTPIPIETDDGDVATGTLRDIRVTLANRGAGGGNGTLRLSVRTPADGQVTEIGSLAVGLAPHETAAFTLRWNTVETGTVGDAEVIARSSVSFDAAPSNDATSTSAFSIIGGSGLGLTAASGGGTCQGAIAAGACVSASASPRTTGAQESASAVIPYEFAYGYAGLGGVSAGAGGGAIVGASVRVTHNVGGGGSLVICAVLCESATIP